MADKLGFSIKELGVARPLSESTLRNEIRRYAESVAAGGPPVGLRAVKYAKRTIVLAEDWRRYLTNLPAVTPADLAAITLATRG
jgi:hypothetical protein